VDYESLRERADEFQRQASLVIQEARKNGAKKCEFTCPPELADSMEIRLVLWKLRYHRHGSTFFLQWDF